MDQFISDPWFPNEINDGKLENLFFFLGGLMVLNIVVFIFIARSYKYRDVGVHPPADRYVAETVNPASTEV